MIWASGVSLLLAKRIKDPRNSKADRFFRLLTLSSGYSQKDFAVFVSCFVFYIHALFTSAHTNASLIAFFDLLLEMTFPYSQRISICSKCVICLQRREHPVSKVVFSFILIKKAESLYKHKFFRRREIQTLQLKTREGRFHNGIKKRKGSKTTPPEASEWKRLNLTFRLKLNLQIFANS